MKDDDSITHHYGKLETVDAREILARARTMRSEYLARLLARGLTRAMQLLSTLLRLVLQAPRRPVADTH